MKIVKKILLKIVILAVKNRCILHGCVFVMKMTNRSFIRNLRCLKLLNLFNRLAIKEDKEGKDFFCLPV